MIRSCTIVLLTALAASVPQAMAAPQVIPMPQQPPGAVQDDDGLDPAAIEHLMAVGAKGTLAIRAIQGTSGAPPASGDEVELILVHRNQPIKQIKSRLDENGIAMIGDVPIAIEVVPVVRIKHAGVLYQENGPAMNPQTPRASMNITVYEVTDDQPKWKVVARQVMAARLPAEMDVVELVTVENLGDKTWLGKPPNEQGRRDTVTLGLPERADNFNLEAGFHGWCCTAYDDNQLHIQMPLMPGRMTYKFSYTVPIVDGRADLKVSAPVATDLATFVVPDDGTQLDTGTLQAAGSETVQGTKLRRFNGNAVASGQSAGLMLVGLTPPAAPAAAAPPPAPPVSTPWMIAGGAAVVVAAGGFVVWRKAQRRPGFGN
ncbi:MAG: hypothetical protein JSR77_05420 [Planctomycetes bacterium]|nr:hypothetical protein [Planctomycetota bacterium]